jgi:glycosidase
MCPLVPASKEPYGLAERDVYYRREGDSLHFGNDLLELQIDAATGRWRSLTDLRDNRTVMHGGELVSPILLTTNGRTQGSRGYGQMFTLADVETVGLHWRLEAIEGPNEKDGSLRVKLAEGAWRVELGYRLQQGRARLERSVRVEYTGEKEALLRHFLLRTPCAVLGSPGETYIEAPGYPARGMRRVSSLAFGQWGHLAQGAFSDAPAWRPPLVGIHNPAQKRALTCWAYTETEPFYPVVERTDRGVMFANRVLLADRFTAGHSLEWGTQYLELFHDEWLPALEKFQGFYDEVGLVTPDDVPEWARSVDMYEVHVGTLSGTKLAPYPTYERLLGDLPRIRDKGFEVVYIMPHVPYPSYSVIDYHDLEIQQGSDAGFRAFIDRAHALGLKVFMDVTMHGVMDRRARRMLNEIEGRSPESYPMEPTMPEAHPYVTEHPEWFSRHENGEIAMTYTYAFDHANASWQEFMAGVFRFYVEEYDVDGFRVDSHTWNFFPNWARDLPYPASRSFYGSVQLFRRVLRELKAIKPDVVLYTETPGPLFLDSHALSYNYDETWLLLSALPMASRKGILCHGANSTHVTTERMTARDIAWWLAQRRLVLPTGSIKVRHLDCHDTYWPTHEFRRDTFGPAARAILGFYAFLDGGFMDYNGADEGMEPFYHKLMQLRRSQPVLKKGTCDYLAVRPSDEMVFAPLWEWEGRYLLPVINFDNKPVEVQLPLPIKRMALTDSGYEVRDLMSDLNVAGPDNRLWDRDDLAHLTVQIDPCGVLLLEFLAVS